MNTISIIVITIIIVLIISFLIYLIRWYDKKVDNLEKLSEIQKKCYNKELALLGKVGYLPPFTIKECENELHIEAIASRIQRIESINLVKTHQ